MFNETAHSVIVRERLLPCRVVVGSMGCIVYTDYVYPAFVPLLADKRQNTHIRDTPNFIRMIESLQASPNCTLVAYDCTSMYRNMEFNELKQAGNDVLP